MDIDNKRKREEYELNDDHNNNQNNNNNFNKQLKIINNNSNNSYNNSLNPLIFNKVLPSLLYKESFKSLLELSLISKQSFKIVQNLICEHQRFIAFYPKTKYFEKYIQYPYNRDHKLIQFKDMKVLYLQRNKSSMSQEEHEKYEGLKEELKEICGDKLSKVVIVGYCDINSYEEDPTLSQFYEFEKVDLVWNRDEAPQSHDEEFDEDGDIDVDDFKFSFEFLSRYKNIRKIQLSTMTYDMSLHIYELDGILKHTSDTLESVKFLFHNTSPKFIFNLLKSKPLIKSISIRLGTFAYYQFIKFLKSSSTYSSSSLISSSNKEKDTSKLVAELFKICDISNNKSLKKLKLRKNIDHDYKSPNNQNPSEFLQNLIGNTTLTTLGLEIFDLKSPDSHQQLLPLLKIPTINSLYCNNDSIEQFLIHCNQNQNIKTLTILKDLKNKFNKDTQIYDNLVKTTTPSSSSSTSSSNSSSSSSSTSSTNENLFLNFFNQNKSLQNLVIYEKELFSNDQLILDCLKSSNNNNLTIKFKKFNKNLKL